MKKLMFILVMVLPVMLSAQWKDFSFKIGYYTPYDLKSGAVYGLDYGVILDRNVTLLFGADLYYKNITNDAYLGSYDKLGVKIRQGQILNEWTGVHVPFTGKIRFEFPVERTNVHPYIIAGLGYGFTHVSLDTYDAYSDEPEHASITYHGFVWQLGGGVMFQISRFTNLLLEINHNYAQFEKYENHNIFTTLNSSGFMFRVGIDVAIPTSGRRGRSYDY